MVAPDLWAEAMVYHFGKERRRGTDRRVPRDAPFAGVERRLADRRVAKREREGPFSAILIILILLVILDTVAWQGYYRHAIVRGLNDHAESVRNWSANVWDWKSTR